MLIDPFRCSMAGSREKIHIQKMPVSTQATDQISENDNQITIEESNAFVQIFEDLSHIPVILAQDQEIITQVMLQNNIIIEETIEDEDYENCLPNVLQNAEKYSSVAEETIQEASNIEQCTPESENSEVEYREEGDSENDSDVANNEDVEQCSEENYSTESDDTDSSKEEQYIESDLKMTTKNKKHSDEESSIEFEEPQEKNEEDTSSGLDAAEDSEGKERRPKKTYRITREKRLENKRLRMYGKSYKGLKK